LEELVSTMTIPARNPRPNASPKSPVHVAPPQHISRTPWAALLDQSFDSGDCTWVMDADGVLLPVPIDDAGAAQRRRVSLRRRRG
jgi:hypothetical protein